MFFDYLAVRIDAMKAADEDLLINWRFTDLDRDYALTLRNGVLTQRKEARHAEPDIHVTMTKALLDRIALKETGFIEESKTAAFQPHCRAFAIASSAMSRIARLVPTTAPPLALPHSSRSIARLHL